MSDDKKRKTKDLNIKKVDIEVFDYVESIGIPMSSFVRIAIKEKIERDTK